MTRSAAFILEKTVLLPIGEKTDPTKRVAFLSRWFHIAMNARLLCRSTPLYTSGLRGCLTPLKRMPCANPDPGRLERKPIE